MALFTLMSPGGSPGVTTTALAASYGWGGRVLLAECDPAGGSVLAGFLAGRMEVRHGGLLDLAMAVGHDPEPAGLWENAVSLDQDAREWLLLPGLREPREAAQLAGAWDAIAEALRAGSTTGMTDVLIDIGRIGDRNTPLSLVAASDLAVMVLRPTLRQVAAAKPRLDALGRHLGDTVPVALSLIEDGDYGAAEVSKALFDLPVVGRIPYDPRSAGVLSDGRPTRKPVRNSALLRGASDLARSLRDRVDHATAGANGSDQVMFSASREAL